MSAVQQQPTEYSPSTASVSAVQQQPTEQSPTAQPSHQGIVPQEEVQEAQRLQQERSDKLTRIMLEVIHRSDIGIAPAAEVFHKAVVNFANYAAQFDQLARAEEKLHAFAEMCMKNHYDHYTERAMLGYDDDQELVDAICVAHDAMPALLPAAFAACIEQEENEVLAQSIELERQEGRTSEKTRGT